MYNVKIKHKNAYQTMCVFYLPRRKYDEKELRELINSRQKNELYGDLKRIYDTTEDTRLKDECAKKINAMAYGHRVDRLEAVKTKIYAEMKKAQEVEQSTHTALHTNTVQKAYRESIASLTKGLDITGSFSQLPRNAIKEMLSKPWLGSNYSSRIWNNNDQFIRKVQTVVENGVTNGHSVSRMADKLTSFIAEPCQGQRYIAERLVRTETAHFMNQGQLRAYKDIGIKQYQYVCAFSEATCDMCGNLDGEIINIDAAIEGDNYPPLHPNCRCTTVIAGYDPDTRIATDPETGENYKVSGNTTFNEWKKTIDFGGKSGIINTGSVSGALNRYSKRATKHAERYYEAVRHMTTDTTRIAKTTGIAKEKIDKIKNHIFIAEHDLFNGRGRFSPSYDMAQSWQRLINGDFKEEDIILLKHEYMELRYMEKGLSQDVAHVKASKRYNYAQYCE